MANQANKDHVWTDTLANGWQATRREATTPRIAAAAAIGAAATAYAYLRNSDRRERLMQNARDLRDRWMPRDAQPQSTSTTTH